MNREFDSTNEDKPSDADFEGHDREERPRRSGNAEDSSRRGFLRKLGAAGFTAALAHFMVLGGNVKKALADNDECPTAISPEPDRCAPSQYQDRDECMLSNQNGTWVEVGDVCPPQDPGDSDLCTHATDGAGREYEVGDVCVNDEDKCWNVTPQGGYTYQIGDDCPDGLDANDYCNVYENPSPPYEVGDVCTAEPYSDDCTYIPGYGPIGDEP